MTSESNPELEKIAVQAVEKAVESAIKTIENRANNQPYVAVAESVVQLSTVGKLGEATKKHTKDQTKLLWSNLKAIGVGAISLIPLIGGAAEASAAAELVDAAVMEGATIAEAEALAKGAIIKDSGKIITPLVKVLGQAGAEKAVKVLKAIDPFPDVPTEFVVAAGVTEAAGVKGAGLAPVAWQLAVNKVAETQNQINYIQQVGEILTTSPEAQRIRDNVTQVKNYIKDRINNAKAPKMSFAAAAFA